MEIGIILPQIYSSIRLEFIHVTERQFKYKHKHFHLKTKNKFFKSTLRDFSYMQILQENRVLSAIIFMIFLGNVIIKTLSYKCILLYTEIKQMSFF